MKLSDFISDELNFWQEKSPTILVRPCLAGADYHEIDYLVNTFWQFEIGVSQRNWSQIKYALLITNPPLLRASVIYGPTPFRFVCLNLMIFSSKVLQIFDLEYQNIVIVMPIDSRECNSIKKTTKQ